MDLYHGFLSRFLDKGSEDRENPVLNHQKGIRLGSFFFLKLLLKRFQAATTSPANKLKKPVNIPRGAFYFGRLKRGEDILFCLIF
jgi:hypothetical protein